MKEGEIICPQCGRETPANGVRCVHCGTAFRVCGTCGAVNRADTAFCTNCGTQLYAPQPAQAGQGGTPVQPYAAQPMNTAPQTAAPSVQQPYAAQPAAAQTGTYKYLMEIWMENDPHGGGAYKAIRALRIVAAVFMGIGYALSIIGLMAVLMFFFSNGGMSVPEVLIFAGDVGCWIMLLFGIAYAALHITYYLYAAGACGKWLKQQGVDGHAMLCDDLRVSETDSRNSVAMAMFVPGMGYARNSIQHKLRQGKDAVYLAENPADWGRYIAGKVLGALGLLLAAGGLCALVWGAWTALSLALWLIPAAVLLVLAITAGILSVTAGNIALKRNAWINEVWAARTGFRLEMKGKNWRR